MTQVQSLFLVFAAVVLLFIVLKWIYFWRKLQRIGRDPHGPESHTKQDS